MIIQLFLQNKDFLYNQIISKSILIINWAN